MPTRQTRPIRRTPPLRRPIRRRRSIRSRLVSEGPGALPPAELVSTLIASPAEKALPVAERLCEPGLALLGRAPLPNLVESRGLSVVGASRLVAAVELGRRVIGDEHQPPEAWDKPSQIHRWFQPRLAARDAEEVWLVLLDSRLRPLHERRIAAGSVHACPVDPICVFGPALEWRATAFVLVHNHPSGDPEPSTQDIELTARLAEGAGLLGLTLVEHLVVAEGRYVSMRRRGLIP